MLIFFQAEDGIRDYYASRGLGDVYKRQKKGFIILVDDVINSGKTMQYALVKFLERPTKTIRTVVLVDRKHRRYPVKADIVGLSLSTTLKDRVEVVFNSKASKAYLI